MPRTCTLPLPVSSLPSKCLFFLCFACNLPLLFFFSVLTRSGAQLTSISLPEPKDDVALEAAIYREFLKYGKCWVKIRRDSHHMPFAFVQFTSDAEAQDALDKGKGALIFGRPCRTEMVKANRTFIIQKKTGTPITIDEAEKVLVAFGQLSKCELLHPQLRDTLGYSATVLVEFSMFDATRDLHTVSIPSRPFVSVVFSNCLNCMAVLFTFSSLFIGPFIRN